MLLYQLSMPSIAVPVPVDAIQDFVVIAVRFPFHYSTVYDLSTTFLLVELTTDCWPYQMCFANDL